MQTLLLEASVQAIDRAWYRAAIRECIAYGEHGIETEENADGHTVCFNCRGSL